MKSKDRTERSVWNCTACCWNSRLTLMIKKRVLSNILMKSPDDVTLLSIMNDNEGRKIFLQSQQKSGGQKESEVLQGKKYKL